MDTKKYKDMVYNNSMGKRWFAILFREDIWDLWVQRVKLSERENKVTESKGYAYRIFLESLWHLGYAEDTGNSEAMTRCADRLRKPPERGLGVPLKKSWGNSAIDSWAYNMPPEFVMFDEFLEHFVRPLI